MNGDLIQLEPWLDKEGLCEYLACSERWLEYRMKEKGPPPLPRAMIAGRTKFKASKVEAWLEEHGYMEMIA